MDARATYEAGRKAAEARMAAHEKTIFVLGAARVVVALAAVAVVIAVVWWGAPPSGLGFAAALALLFVVLVAVHSRAFDGKARAEAARDFHVRGLARLDGTWRAFPSRGEKYASPTHRYTDDLDIFGPSSLFQLVDATETPFGQDALASLLASGRLPAEEASASSWKEALVARQGAVRELASAVPWREMLSVEGAVLKKDATDPAPFLAWAEEKEPLGIPVVVVWLARILPFVVLGVWLEASRLGVPKATWAAVVVLEILISLPFRSRLASTVAAVSAHAGGFARYGSLFRTALAGPHDAPALARIRARLAEGGGQGGVADEMARLERVVSFMEARRNEVFRLFFGTVLMWDLNFVVLLDAWRRRSGSRVRGWFSALGEIEALASLGSFAFDRPDHAWPALSDEAKLEATGLGHPLIDASRRIGNDVALSRGGTALVVTGSNMSGKSTLLRALGVNTVLAQAGAPVTAKSLSLGQVTLATSMRIRDSLDEGVSHFYAELQKLKRVVDLAREPPPLLFLLDEILHGTNSRERIIGARAVIRGLVERGALGAVSTHDLGIVELSDVLPTQITSVHFEEQVHEDGTMTFDYHLRPGPVTSSNALRLMRAIGLEVPLGEPDARP